MLKLKLLLIFLVNLLFLPFYIFFFLLCLFMTFIPIFPVVTARKNVKDRLGIKGLKNRLFIARVFLNYVFYLFEIIFFEPLRLTHASLPKNFNLKNLIVELQEVFPEGKNIGFTYLAGHVANLEFQTIPIVKAKKILKKGKVLGLARVPRSKIIIKILTWHRERPGLGMIWTDRNLFANMRDALAKDCSLCLVADQKPKKKGIFIRFFGEYAAFPTTGLRFCMEQKSVVVYSFSYRIIPGWVKNFYQCGKNFHLDRSQQVKSIYENSDGLIEGDLFSNGDQDIIDTKDVLATKEMTYFVKWLEDNIKKYPTQWSWDYRKWSRRAEENN